MINTPLTPLPIYKTPVNQQSPPITQKNPANMSHSQLRNKKLTFTYANEPKKNKCKNPSSTKPPKNLNTPNKQVNTQTEQFKNRKCHKEKNPSSNISHQKSSQDQDKKTKHLSNKITLPNKTYYVKL